MKKLHSQPISLKLGSRLFGAIFFFVTLMFFVPILQAQNYETLDQSFEFKTGGTVKVENVSGDIKVEVWAEELVHVIAKKVEPAGRPMALSDVAFFNTKSQINIKTQPSEKTSRVNLAIYIPRNTSLRLITNNGSVQIKGSVASALVETGSGNIKMESPSSQDADLVMTTKEGTIKSELPVEPYIPPTSKSLQGKLNSGGNPVILRSSTGNIQLALLAQELDKDVATIPSIPAVSSSADSSNYYGNNSNNNYNNNSNNNSSNNNDTLFGNSTPTLSKRNNANNQPYTYGGSYGGNSGGSLSGRNNPNSNNSGYPNNSNNSNKNNSSNSSSSNSNNSNNSSSSNNSSNTDIFGGGQKSDGTDNSVDAGNLGVNRTKSNSSIDNQGGIGVRIIPPPGSSRPQQNDDYNNQNNSNYQNNYPSNNATPPPLKRRNNNNDSSYNNSGNNNSGYNSNPQYNSPDNSGQDPFGDIASNSSNNNNTTPPTIKRNNYPNNSSSRNTTNNSDDNSDAIKIDTKLVSLNVSVMNRDGRAVTNLKTEDFQVYEDGIQQQIEHFEPVNTPFNLVILIDLSGSIIDKIDILRRAVLRFIETCRPEDRLAIVSFTRSVQVVCELTNDRELIKQRLQYMTMPKGGTAYYEAMWFTVTQMFKQVEGQRNAIVVLTDGVDNSISATYPMPSRVTFDQVLHKVQESGLLIFPIYLDTEKENVSQDIELPESYNIARKQLGALAESSGGIFFKAERPENLNGVYEKVAAELRTLYSLAYYPTNSARDGTWRKLKVKVDKADLAIRTRRGYYAK